MSKPPPKVVNKPLKFTVTDNLEESQRVDFAQVFMRIFGRDAVKRFGRCADDIPAAPPHDGERPWPPK